MKTTLLKSKKFRYFLTLLGSFSALIIFSLIYPTMNETIYNGFSVLLPREQFISYEAYILFGSQLSIYALLKDTRTTWYPLLAYPKSMRKTLIRKALLAFIATLPTLIMTTFIHIITISSKDVSYLWMIYAMHYTVFILENYGVADGYLNNQIVNIIHVLSFPFFYFVISNQRDWLPILVNLCIPIFITMLIILVIIFIRIDTSTRKILFHEIFLKDYFKNNVDGKNILIVAKAKKLKNKLNLYQRLDPHRKGYWHFIAYFDVLLKKRFLLILLLLFLLIFKLYLLMLMLMIILLILIIYDYYQLRKAVHRVLCK